MAPAAVVSSDEQSDLLEPLVVNSWTVINGSVSTDTIVQKNCSLHVRGNIVGSLTLEPGANVLVDGSVDGKIINRGGRLVVNNKGLTACVALHGPSESEAGAILKINLTAIAFNWERLAKSTDAECAAVLRCNAYGCGIDPIAEALTKSGCRTFFVTNLSEARRVRAAAPNSVVYVLHGLHVGTGAAFAKLNARPVINSSIELAEWDAFVTSGQWTGGCALNVDTGENRLGLPVEEAVALASRLYVSNHGITLLMSALAGAKKPNDAQSERQIGLFRELRRLYAHVPASLAGSSGIFRNPKCHFDLVRAGSALFGINPTPGSANPMLPVVELRTYRAGSRCDPGGKLRRRGRLVCKATSSDRVRIVGIRRRPSAIVQKLLARRGWRVPVPHDGAPFFGPVADRRHRSARRQDGPYRRNGYVDRIGNQHRRCRRSDEID